MAKLSNDRLARYRGEAEASMSSADRLPLYNLPVGVTKVRVLPGMEPGSMDKDFYVKVYMHFNVNPASKLPVICTRTKDPRDYCPVCNKVQELKASGNEQNQKEAENMAARIKYAMGIIPLEGEHKGKPMVYLAPKAIWTKIISLFEDSEYGDVTDPYEGFDMKFTKAGTGRQGTTYDATPGRNPSAIADSEEEIEEILAAQPPIWRFRETPTKEDIENFMDGNDRFETGIFSAAGNAEEPEETEEKAPPVQKVTAPAPRVVSKPTQQPAEEQEEEAPPPPIQPRRSFKNLDVVREKLRAK